MEVKEVEEVVITKPVASKPSSSTFRSFSELLAGAISASLTPANVCSETAVSAIRPKTVRVKPIVNRASITLLSSQGEASGKAPLASFDKVSKLPQGKSSVVYKPLAKVVSKATVSLLARMGSPDITHQQASAQVEASAQHLNQKSPKKASETAGEEQKPFIASADLDRPSYDGYNWRKYGQKQVKGSEYPRSYYKCTHPSCPVKKKVERSFDGQIAEIVYTGEHNHSKPQPPKKSSSGAQGPGLASDGTGHDQGTNNYKWSNNISEMNEDSKGHLENHGVGVGLPTQSAYPSKSQMLPYDPSTTGAYSIVSGTPDNMCGRRADGEGSKGLEVDDDEPKRKRRKSGDQKNESGALGEGIQEPRVLVQNTTEAEMLGDGFCWRKYGQKFVKGNPYPRSYYKCTSLKCSMRKHVERASDDLRAFITTYEGKHNHDMPLKITNSAVSQPESQTPSDKNRY